MRRVHRLIAALEQFFLDERFQKPPDGCSFRHPQDQSAAGHGTDGEEPQLLAEYPVITLAGFLQLMKIRVEVFLVEKRSPVEPLELLAAGVVLPVSAGNAQEFESADLAGMRNVWPAAEVNEFALTIKAEGRILLQVIIDVFNLVSLAQVLAESSGFRSGPFKAFERLCLGDDACHFFFDAREVGFGE